MRGTTPDGYWAAQIVLGAVLAVLAALRVRVLMTGMGFVAGVVALVITRAVPMYGG